MAEKPIFGKYQVPTGEHILLKSDNFYLGAKRESDGWLLLQEQSENQEAENPDFSQADFYQSGKSNKLIISPAMPEKPLVFKGSRLHVSPGQRLNFFVKIPLNVQIYFLKTDPENLLKEFSLKRLSDTWFGDAFSGEPAFTLGSEFFFTMEETGITEFEAFCPIQIFNDSSIVLEVERFILRVEDMALYKNKNRYLTSQLQVEYKGKEVFSSASYHFTKAIHGEKVETILQPRGSGAKNLLRINFHFIKNLYKPEE